VYTTVDASRSLPGSGPTGLRLTGVDVTCLLQL